MASKRTERVTDSKPRSRPKTTLEGRENQLVSLAVDLAEKQLRDGTASSQLISHYLKLGSSREQLEQERLRNENDLLAARSHQIASAAKVEELYKTALDAMRSYAGHVVEERDDYDD